MRICCGIYEYVNWLWGKWFIWGELGGAHAGSFEVNIYSNSLPSPTFSIDF